MKIVNALRREPVLSLKNRALHHGETPEKAQGAPKSAAAAAAVIVRILVFLIMAGGCAVAVAMTVAGTGFHAVAMMVAAAVAFGAAMAASAAAGTFLVPAEKFLFERVDQCKNHEKNLLLKGTAGDPATGIVTHFPALDTGFREGRPGGSRVFLFAITTPRSSRDAALHRPAPTSPPPRRGCRGLLPCTGSACCAGS